MPINASHQYYKAYAEYLEAHTIEERIEKLKIAISLAPKHKGSENLLSQLRGTLAKLKKEVERQKIVRKRSGHKGIKKTGHAQAIILGRENSGKSSLLAVLTNAKPKISEIAFTTVIPEIGTLDLEGIKVQTIEMPAAADNELLSMIYGTDLLIILVNSIDDLVYWINLLKQRSIKTKKIIAFSKSDILKEQYKTVENFKDILKISVKTGEGIPELKKRIFENLGLIRIYTKEPGRKITPEPMIIEKNSTIKDMAKSIRNDFVERFKSAKVWGLSARYPGQNCSLDHILQDKDIVEMYIK